MCFSLLVAFAFSCGSLQTILSFCKRLLTQEWKAVCSCRIKTNLDQEPNSLAFFYSLGTLTAPQLCFSKNSGKKKWKLCDDTLRLLLNSWRCLLCSLLGLGFAHWYVLSSISSHLRGDRSLLLYNYTGFFPVTIDIITNSALRKEIKPVLSASWIARSTYRAARTDAGLITVTPPGVCPELSWTLHWILHQQVHVYRLYSSDLVRSYYFS